MKNLKAGLTLVFILLLLNHAASGESSPGWGPENDYNRLYNPNTAEKLSGEIEDLEMFYPRPDMSVNVRLVLKTGRGPIPVHLGPAWYIEATGVELAPGDRIQVTGSRIVFAGKPAIIASEVKKGDQVLKLRDETGYPQWRMGRVF